MSVCEGVRGCVGVAGCVYCQQLCPSPKPSPPCLIRPGGPAHTASPRRPPGRPAPAIPQTPVLWGPAQMAGPSPARQPPTAVLTLLLAHPAWHVATTATAPSGTQGNARLADPACQHPQPPWECSATESFLTSRTNPFYAAFGDTPFPA